MTSLLLKSSLLCVYTELGAENKLYSFNEVHSLFKDYVFANRHLIDAENPSKINCKDDVLGKALGVDSFSIDEAKMLLSKCVTPVSQNLSRSNLLNEVLPSVSNRPQPSSSPPADVPCRKSNCQCPTVFSVSQSLPYNSEAETVYSYQGYDTTQCDDDYEAESYHSDEIGLELEFEPASDADEYEPVTDIEPSQNDTDSEAVSFASGILVMDHSDDFNEDFFADESDSSRGSDDSCTEDEPDKWTCLTCDIQNRPYMRYCQACWKVRKEWFPERPKRKKRRKSRPKKERKSLEYIRSARSNDFEQVISSSLKRLSSQKSNSAAASCSSQDSGVVFSLDIAEELHDSEADEPPAKLRRMFGPTDLRRVAVKFRKFTSTNKGRQWVMSRRADTLREVMRQLEPDSDTEEITRKFGKFTNSLSGRRWLQSSSAGSEFLTNLGTISSDSDCEISDRKCSICWCKVANASIVHGSSSHLGICYPCAKRLVNTNSRCPACRRKIDRITKICYL